jgi:NDP-sugar pyrophosphorylase family protein
MKFRSTRSGRSLHSHSFINAGAYLLEPEVYDFIPSGRRFDMTELIQELIEAGKAVVSFPIMEYGSTSAVTKIT